MIDRTASHHGDRPQIELASDIAVPVQQIRHWIMAHRLGACRVCTGFRIDELGLRELASPPRPQSQPLGPRS